MFKLIEQSIAKLQANPLRFEVVQNAGVAFIVKVISMATMLLLEFFIARILEFDQFGVYTFVLVWVLTLTVVGSFGFNTSSIRFVSEYFFKQEGALLKGFLNCSLLVSIVVSTSLTAISLGVVNFLEGLNLIAATLANVFYIALPLTPLFSLIFVQSGILRGGKFLILALFFQNVFVYALLFILILAGFYGQLFAISVNSIFILFYFSTALTIIFQQIAIRRKFDIYKIEARGEWRALEWIKTSISMMLSSSLQELINRIDIIAIGIFISPAATGVYAIALRFSRLINVGLQITNESSAHLFKPLFSQGEKEKLQQLVFTTAKITFFTTIPLVAILLVFPTFILSQYGDEFLSGRILLRILLIGQLVNVLSGPNGLILNMTIYQDLLARIFTITFLVDIVLLFVLLPTLGINGAALATTGSILFRNLIVNFYVWRNLNINPTVISLRAWKGAAI